MREAEEDHECDDRGMILRSPPPPPIMINQIKKRPPGPAQIARHRSFCHVRARERTPLRNYCSNPRGNSKTISWPVTSARHRPHHPNLVFRAMTNLSTPSQMNFQGPRETAFAICKLAISCAHLRAAHHC